MKRTTLLSAATPLAVAAAAILAVGDLNPPAGAVTATGKRLTELEPRIPIGATTTPGDADSTFRITTSGSYYLTGNVTGEAAKKGIEIISSGQLITIDLNGFTLQGTGASSTQPAIYVDGLFSHVVVRNGLLRGWRQGIQHAIGGTMAVEDVVAQSSLLAQFELKNATVVRCRAESGAGIGFNADNSSFVDCAAFSNASTGFRAINTACSTTRCLARANTGAGYDLLQGVANDCVADGNGSIGFNGASQILGCSALDNLGDGASLSFSGSILNSIFDGNGGDGIQISQNTRIEGCTVSVSGRHGINVIAGNNSIVGNTVATSARSTSAFAGIFVAGNDNTIDGNHVSNVLLGGDDFGIQVTGTSNLIVRNQLTACSTYFSIAASNTSGGSSTTPATAAPWANITY